MTMNLREVAPCFQKPSSVETYHTVAQR